jgi:transposase
MARGKTLSVVFKANHQNQAMLLPPDINEMIAANHPVRVVNEVLEKVDISELIKQYKPGGTSSNHPRMLLRAPLIFETPSFINDLKEKQLQML